MYLNLFEPMYSKYGKYYWRITLDVFKLCSASSSFSSSNNWRITLDVFKFVIPPKH